MHGVYTRGRHRRYVRYQTQILSRFTVRLPTVFDVLACWTRNRYQPALFGTRPVVEPKFGCLLAVLDGKLGSLMSPLANLRPKAQIDYLQ